MDLQQASRDTADHPLALPPEVDVPPPLAADVAAFSHVLADSGLDAALRFLNKRTPHRFTGVFRFDGQMLRSVALVDKWLPHVVSGDDVPLAQAYCAHLHTTGEPIGVSHGPSDPRVPWMAGSPVVSYCGSPIRDDSGRPWGALCHFDTARCDTKVSDMPLLVAASALLYRAALAHRG